MDVIAPKFSHFLSQLPYFDLGLPDGPFAFVLPLAHLDCFTLLCGQFIILHIQSITFFALN